MSDILLPVTSWSAAGEARRREVLRRPAATCEAEEDARAIVDSIRAGGDNAVRTWTRKLDNVDLDALKVSQDELNAALDETPADLKRALQTAARHIGGYHRAQQRTPTRYQPINGVTCERLARPLSAVGLYVPAGNAPLPSTALMLGIPARIARCPQVVLCTPPQSDGRANPLVLAAAKLCGITNVFRVGGPQAIAAMAYGTESIPKVDKIFGPGNAWVTAAKQIVARRPDGAALDLPAGPSELMVIADSSADPVFVASDLLSQAEHGPDSQVILVTDDTDVAEAARDEALRRARELPRREIMQQSLARSQVIVVANLREAVEISNIYAPEHLILNVHAPRRLLNHIFHAGSVFLGPWTPEAIGDYCSGTNHVLPTYGYARAYSGLGLSDFQKYISVQEVSRNAFVNIGWVAEALADAEGLGAHAEAVRVRNRRLAEPAGPAETRQTELES